MPEETHYLIRISGRLLLIEESCIDDNEHGGASAKMFVKSVGDIEVQTRLDIWEDSEVYPPVQKFLLQIL